MQCAISRRLKDKAIPLPKHHVMKLYGEMEVKLHMFLSSELDGGEWSVSYSGHVTSGNRLPVIHCLRGQA